VDKHYKYLLTFLRIQSDRSQLCMMGRRYMYPTRSQYQNTLSCIDHQGK